MSLTNQITRSPDHQITRSSSSSSASPRLGREIPQYYAALLSRYGPQNWWPAQSRFEVIVGAYLTQNTAWTNVEMALANLRGARLLSISGSRRTPQPKLDQLIRPAGYFLQKAQVLKTFVRFLYGRYSGLFV